MNTDIVKHTDGTTSATKMMVLYGFVWMTIVLLVWLASLVLQFDIDPNFYVFSGSVLGILFGARPVQMGLEYGIGLARRKREEKPKPETKQPAKPKQPTKPKPKPKPVAKPTQQAYNRQSPALRKDFGYTVADLHCNDAGKTPVPASMVKGAEKLLDNLAVIWDACGRKKMRINSGYRTPEYNLKIKGAKGSYHMKAMAADIRIDGMKPTEVRNMIVKLMDDGRITKGGYYCKSSFTHYDIRGTKIAIKW